jgi:hypothetical protein
MSKVEEEKTLKFKAIRMPIEELGKMLDEDPRYTIRHWFSYSNSYRFLWHMI